MLKFSGDGRWLGVRASLLALFSLVSYAACALGGCGSDPAAGACTGSGVTLTGVVKELTPGKERQMYPTMDGVEVCVYQHDEVPCVTTGKAGTFSLCDVPKDSELMLSFKKDAYAQSMRMITTKKADYAILAETVLGSIKYGTAQLKYFGFSTSDLSGGVVQFFAANPSNGVLQVSTLSDFTAQLLKPDGTATATCGQKGGGTGPCAPVYLNDTGEPDPKLTKSSRWGVGAFGNVAPGKYLLRIKHPTLVCDEHLPESGWMGKDVDTVFVEVVKDWVTAQVGLFCQPPE